MASKISSDFQAIGTNVLLVDENVPASLVEREKAVKWSQVCAVLASHSYQRDPYLLELANYAKVSKKSIVALLDGTGRYSPSGSLGAVCAANGEPVDATAGNYIDVYKQKTKNLTIKSEGSKPKNDLKHGVRHSKIPGSGILVSYTPDGKAVCDFVARSIADHGKVTKAKSGDDNDKQINDCALMVAIITSSYSKSKEAQHDYETARAGRKVIVPVIGERGYHSKLQGWMSLAIAGKLYYYMPTEAEATASKFDSSVLTDFKYALGGLLKPVADEEDREDAEKEALNLRIEKAKTKLAKWPPVKRAIEDRAERPLSKDDLVVNADENLPLNYIHHEITRMTFICPEPLFNASGVPLRRRFDAMLSYQWDMQHFVRDIYMDLSTASLKVWMDIQGGMQGNVYEAMSNAVECSVVVICVLTNKYMTSENCQLELKYAAGKHKVLIFLRAEKNVKIPDWVSALIEHSLVYDLFSRADLSIKEGGVPRIFRICEGVRRACQLRPANPENMNISDELFNKRELLEDALCEIALNEGKQRFDVCTRCEAKFDESSAHGCKRHRAYYMGGNILAGRWVCCSQRGRDTLGCEDCDHFTKERSWQEMSGFDGCFKFNPE